MEEEALGQVAADVAQHRRVAYDHERSAGALVERFGDKEWTQALADRVRNARFS